jgi:hypothetical protein
MLVYGFLQLPTMFRVDEKKSIADYQLIESET